VPNGTHRVGKEGDRGLHGQQDVPESQAALQTAVDKTQAAKKKWLTGLKG
jgi:hypothetical protein